MRLVATEPSITATLAAIGAADALVAVSTHCHRLTPAVSGLPRVETTWAVTPEAILPHAPDLVIVAPPYREGQVEALLKAGLRVLCLYPSTLASVVAEARLLGQLVGRAAEAEAAITAMEDALSPPVLDGERVYIEIWPKPFTTAPVWVYDIVRRLGGSPVPPTPNSQPGEAGIIEADPEIAVVAWAGIERLDATALLNREGWQGVAAVQGGRVHTLDEIAINAPGLNLTRGIEALREVLA